MKFLEHAVRLEARYFGDDERTITFSDVAYTYVEAKWRRFIGASGDSQLSQAEPPRLDVMSLPASVCSEDWNFIVFAGPGQGGREIIGKHTLANGVVRFTLR